ncbi:YggS family pyridoxal phosphate-dependent enzyme [Candidatus Sororendozoicomonas aggregata]|uniref:YggS family pyridoxal phosphate-dependent enzyme n=1 Tax=Candidatus Sororendozoicomonas aggregata TaxID=3073239 RepID=UPI002ED5665C
MNPLQHSFEQVFERIEQAKAANGRTENVQLLAVSKKKSASVIEEAYHLGQRHFGESYVQEALEKQATLKALPGICWHFIGPIQSNKTRDIASHFQWVHSVDRLKIATRLNEQRPERLPPLNICLQVNISAEASKSGATEADLPALVNAIKQLPCLRLRGLMAIPAATIDAQAQRLPFKAMADHLTRLNQQFALHMDTLSMGMTGDLEVAIAEGATIVRVGTALFGKR